MCLSSTTIKLGFKTTVCYKPRTVCEATKKKKTYDCLSRKRRRRSYMMDSFSLSLSSLSLASTPCKTSNAFKFTASLSQAQKTSILLLNTKAKIFTKCVCLPARRKSLSQKSVITEPELAAKWQEERKPHRQETAHNRVQRPAIEPTQRYLWDLLYNWKWWSVPPMSIIGSSSKQLCRRRVFNSFNLWSTFLL